MWLATRPTTEKITYDDKKKIIYIPVVGDKGQVTRKNILYQSKDIHFELIGIDTFAGGNSRATAK